MFCVFSEISINFCKGDSDMNGKEAARIFKAFADENRIAILKILKEGEKCGLEILEEMNISQSTLSHHMKILCDSGVTESRRDGKQVYYRISAERAELAADYMRELSRAVPTRRSRRNDDVVIL